MHGKITFFLALCWLSLLSTQAQIAPATNANTSQLLAVADSTDAAGTTQAWWDHVASLKQKGVTGTSGPLTHYSELTSGKFAGKQPGEAVVIADGKKHAFYDLDLRDLSVLIRGGSEVAFYNCRFGQSPGMELTNDAPLTAVEEGTKLVLRFCDFVGPGDGSGSGAMLRGPEVWEKQHGKAAFIDAAYCRTWGQASDSWKITHSIARFCYFDPSVATKKMPEKWNATKNYQSGDYVTEGTLYTSHVWRAWRTTSEKPSFANKADKFTGIKASNGWVYINPHADIFHIYGGRYEVRAEGLFLNSEVDQIAEPVEGVAMIGLNNSVRRGEGEENYPIQEGGTIRGSIILRDPERPSFAIHNSIGRKGVDSELLKLAHLRIGGLAKRAVYVGGKDRETGEELPASPSILDSLQDLKGISLQLPQFQQKIIDSTNAYFARGNPRSQAPTLVLASQWRVKPTIYAPADDKNGNRVNAVVYFANGKRVAYVTENQEVFDASGYKIKPMAEGEYELTSENGAPFHLVVWRGESTVLAPGQNERTNPLPTAASQVEIAEFSRDKAPFDSGAGRKKNSARIPFKAVVRNAQNQPVSGAVVEGRIVTATGQPVATWEVIGTTNRQGEAQGNLYTQRHPEYLQREVRIQGNNQVVDQSENSFGVGHTIVVLAQSNLDQGFMPSHFKTAKPAALSTDMVQHYYHERDDGNKVANPRVGPKYIRRWDTGVSDSVDVTGWPTAFANALTESRPGEKFFVVWHVHEGTGYTDMVGNGGKRIPQVEAALADYVYADGQARGGIVGGAWTHTPGSTGLLFEEAHFPIFFAKRATGDPVTIPSSIDYGARDPYNLDHWIGDWYDLDEITYALQDPHQFGPRGFTLKSATLNADGKLNYWFTKREDIRQSIREMVQNPNATNSLGEKIILPIYMGALNYAIGEVNKSGTGYGDGTHPSDNTPDGGMLFNALIAHGFLRAAGLTDWPEPVFDRHYRHPSGAWWEWWSTAGPITTTRRVREEKRPTPPAGDNALHWTEVVAFQIDKKPATRVEIINGRVRIYPPTGETFAPDDLSRISHGDGGASGHLNDGPDRIAELWKDIAIIDFDLPGIDGVALRAQIPPTKAGNATNNEYVDDTPATDPSPDTTRPYVETVVATSTEITATYSEPIRQRGFGRVLIKTVPANQTVVDMEVTNEGTTPGTIEYDGAKVIVRPASPLPAGEYAWRPHKNIFEDLAGNFAEDVINNYYHPFTIGASARTATDRDKITPEGEMLSSSVYPNPNHGQFTVHIPEAEGNRVSISILSLSGQVLSEVQTQGARHIPMRMSLPAGTYIVKIVSPEASYVERLIVE